MINLTINGKKIKTAGGKSILEAALEAGIYIPNLCYHPQLCPTGSCRLCIVNIEGRKGHPTSCTTAAAEGMVVDSRAPELKEMRKNIMWLTLSQYSGEIEKSTQLKKVFNYIGKKDMLPGFNPVTDKIPEKREDPLFIRDMNRCILCGRCVRICRETRKAGVLGFTGRGIKTIVGTSYDRPLSESACRFCLACVEVCPSGALKDKKSFSSKDREKVLLPCNNNCPAGIDAALYVKLIARGRHQDALEVIRKTVPFPEVLGHVCDHPCEQECRRGGVNDPIAIRALKGFAARQDTGRWRSKIKIPPSTGKKVAVAGSGPAGLSAAWFLRKLGHSVTVFEALPEAGGMMRTGIPAYRLPREVLDREISEIENIGVKIKTDSPVRSFENLFCRGFDAVLLATGAYRGMAMGIEGEDDSRVLQGIDVLQKIAFNEQTGLGEDIAVVGGGNVAIDVARSALRAGAKNASILYRRTRKEMPALEEEVKEALDEGVKITFLTSPTKITASGGRLKIECIKMKLGEPDSSGRRRPVPVEGSNYIMEADNLIMAIGQKPLVPKEFKKLLNSWGAIEASDETAETGLKGVFAAGDAATGPASVIKAIAGGRKAASSIDKYLGGSGNIDQDFISPPRQDPCLGREEGFGARKRVEISLRDPGERKKDFERVECYLDKKEAAGEAERCLSCALRLTISPPPLPPDKKN